MKKRNRYKLLKLDAKKVLDGAKINKDSGGNWMWTFQYELSKTGDWEIIDSIIDVDDNALFFQLGKVLGQEESGQHDSEKLFRHILIMDFSSIFNDDIKKLEDKGDHRNHSKSDLETNAASSFDWKLKWLFDENSRFSLTFKNRDQTKETIDFVPFDKSGSMSRKSRMTFIDKSTKTELDKRLNLFDFSGIPVNLSKYYAYRGLYLTSSFRIESLSSLLNENTVIVVDDYKYAVSGISQYGILTGNRKDKDGKAFWEITEDNNDKSENLTAFDGEGLISPEFMALINEELLNQKYYDDKLNFDKILLKKLGKINDMEEEGLKKVKSDTAVITSFQMRMPFAKGMLHSVDFKHFIQRQYDDLELDHQNITITDAFGKKRNLHNVQIILTVSMFKCFHWLKAYAKKHKIQDPMRFYFKEMKHYIHTLYVANTSISFSGKKQVVTNYQFLNPLNLEQEKFKTLCEQHTGFINDICEKPDKQKDFLLQYSDFDEAEQTSTDNGANDHQNDIYNHMEPWLYALSKNDNFLYDPWVQTILKSKIFSLKEQLMEGKLITKGECRFLSHDLLRLLTNLLIKTLPSNQNKPKHKAKINWAFIDKFIYQNRFYMPANNINLLSAHYYAIMRNPHLSRNEEVTLKPYIPEKNSLYDQYFGHLTSVIMVSTNALVPQALGGADFDGDIVKIIDNKLIVDAILNGCYTKENRKIKKARSLPVISIPSVQSKNPVTPPPSVDYQTIKDTFSNSIGIISNRAVLYGRYQYGNWTKQKEKDRKDKFLEAHVCESATIITGLDIDAAKTGIRPIKNIGKFLENPEGTAKSKHRFQKDPYLKKLDDLKKYKTKKYWRGGAKINADTQKNYILYYQPNKTNQTKVFSTSIKKAKSNLDLLPWYYCQVKSETDYKLNQQKKPKELIFFNFQKENNQDKKLDPDKLATVNHIVQAYNGFIKLEKDFQSAKKNFADSENKIAARLITILKGQYDNIDEKYSKTELSIRNAFNVILTSLREYFDQFEAKEQSEAEKALLRFINLETQWQYISYENREKSFKEIIGLSCYDGVDQHDSDCKNTSDSNKNAPVPSNIMESKYLDLLFNFNNQGYMLLYYLLKGIIASKDINEDYVEPQKQELSKNPYFKELNALFSEHIQQKQDSTIWKSFMLEWAKEKIKTECNSINEAVPYIFKSDRKKEFFWKIIEPDFLKSGIYLEEKPKKV